MSEIFKYVDSVVQANVVLKNCFETIDRLNDEIYTEKIIRGSKYRETIKKLKNKNAKFPEMELRDYFASKAFQSLIAYALPDSIPYTLNNMPAIDIDIELLSRDAYLYADAMMKARAEE